MKKLACAALTAALVITSLAVAPDTQAAPKTKKIVMNKKSVKLAVGGKGMLLWQGAESYKLYTGLEMPTDEYQKFQAENEGK